MRPIPTSIPPTPAATTRHLRPVVTDGLARAVRLPRRRRTCTPEVVGKVVRFAAAPARSVAAARAAIPAAPPGPAVWDCLYLALPARRRLIRRRQFSSTRRVGGSADSG
jgi:putative transposase